MFWEMESGVPLFRILKLYVVEIIDVSPDLRCLAKWKKQVDVCKVRIVVQISFIVEHRRVGFLY